MTTEEYITLEGYIQTLTEYMEANPQTRKMRVVAAKDEECNGFMAVVQSPEAGLFEPPGEFTFGDELEDDQQLNAVCVT